MIKISLTGWLGTANVDLGGKYMSANGLEIGILLDEILVGLYLLDGNSLH